MSAAVIKGEGFANGGFAIVYVNDKPYTPDEIAAALAAFPDARQARQRATRRSGPVRGWHIAPSGVGIPAGRFSSAAQAARTIGVSPSAMANHLNNPDKFPTVAGMRFERVKE